MAKTFSLVFGVLFLLMGLLGFVPNPIVGDGSMFHTDMMHNVVHLVFGLVLLYTGTKGADKAPMALKVVGGIYLLLALLGWVMGGDSLLGLVAVNGADHWLHLVLGALMVYGGWKKSAPAMAAPMSSGSMGGMGGQM